MRVALADWPCRRGAPAPMHAGGLDPAAHALGVADAAELAGGIQEHHDQLAAGDLGLHHQALAGFGDVAGLLQADVPVRVLHQPVGVVELQGAVADFDLVLGRGGELAQHRIVVGGVDQQRQVLRARLVAAGQAGRLDVAGVLHAQHLGLGVHQRSRRRPCRPDRCGPARAPRGFRWTSAPGAAVRRGSAWCRPSGASGCPFRCRRRPG